MRRSGGWAGGGRDGMGDLIRHPFGGRIDTSLNGPTCAPVHGCTGVSEQLEGRARSYWASCILEGSGEWVCKTNSLQAPQSLGNS